MKRSSTNSEKYPNGSKIIASTGKRNLIRWRPILINFKNKEKMLSEKNNTADRELIITRELNAPIELVWEVWTDPEHLAQWWGPDGFTNTISKMDMKPGGDWDLVMHGPDGTDYKNKSVFREIVKYRKIVYDHVSGPRFIATISFEERGNKTFLHWHMLFETKEQFIQTVKTFKADIGLKQNVQKLELYLANMKHSQ